MTPNAIKHTAWDRVSVRQQDRFAGCCTDTQQIDLAARQAAPENLKGKTLFMWGIVWNAQKSHFGDMRPTHSNYYKKTNNTYMYTNTPTLYQQTHN